MYKAGSFGGLRGMSLFCLSSSCSCRKARCFLLTFNSPDLDRRSKVPRLERRDACGGCDFPASGIAASLSLAGELPPEGVRGRVADTMFDCLMDESDVDICTLALATVGVSQE